MLNYFYDTHLVINCSMVFTILPMIRASSATRCREILRKIKSESGLEFQEKKFSERRKSLTSDYFEDTKSKLGFQPKIDGCKINDSWEIPISNDNRKFLKNKKSNFSVKSLSLTSSDGSFRKEIPSPSLQSPSSPSPFDDVYSISCLTDLREMQMKSDPNIFLQTSDPDLNQQDSTSSPKQFQLVNNPYELDIQSNLSNSHTSSGSSENKNTNTRGDDEEMYTKVECQEKITKVGSQPAVDIKVIARQSNGSLSGHTFYSGCSVRERKSIASIVPIDEPLTVEKDISNKSQPLNRVISVSSKLFEVDRYVEDNKESVEFPEVVLSIKKESKTNTEFEVMKQHVDEFDINPSFAEEVPPPILNMCTVPTTRVSNTGAMARPTKIRTVSTPTDIDSKNRLCMSCAESLVTKWRRIIVALTKNQRQVRKTKISGIASQKTGEDDKNSTFSFIFTTSLTGSKEPITFFDKNVLSDNKDFDAVEDICSTTQTNAALAQMTSTFAGVLLYRQRCWHLTDYLCIGDRYCASNGQLLCQMSVAGLVILCCHDNCTGETNGWTASRFEHFSASGSPIKSNRQSEQLFIAAPGRPVFPSGYTHPECDSDHAIPMIPCICGPKVKPSERHNRSALRLNLTGSNLIEIQACFPEMNRFIDGFRKIGRRVMIVSASYPEHLESGGSQLTSSNERLNKDSLAFSNLGFDLSGEEISTQSRAGNSQKKQHPTTTTTTTTISTGIPTFKTSATDTDHWQGTSPLPGDTLTVLAALQHLMSVDRMTFREARNVLLRAQYPLRLSKGVISLLESIECSMDLQRRRAARE